MRNPVVQNRARQINHKASVGDQTEALVGDLLDVEAASSVVAAHWYAVARHDPAARNGAKWGRSGFRDEASVEVRQG